MINGFQIESDLCKHADWPQVEMKAKRLVQTGNVVLHRNGETNIVATVIGDHGTYTTEIMRQDPNSRAITTWSCECPWDQYAWDRTRQWRKYEGRVCSHVLATFWKALTTPLDPDAEQPPPPGQTPQDPSIFNQPGQSVKDQTIPAQPGMSPTLKSPAMPATPPNGKPLGDPTNPLANTPIFFSKVRLASSALYPWLDDIDNIPVEVDPWIETGHIGPDVIDWHEGGST